MLTAKAACEGIRKHAPNAKINLGHCEPIFSLPLFKAGLPGNLPHGIGVDTPQFERMPEMPVRSVTPSRMWLLKDGLRQLGIRGLEINHVESYFPSSHPLALGHRVSADYVVRTAVLSLAQGSTRLLYCFALDDCSDYWGNQHYGCAGLIGAPPDSHPKPAFPAYATMTRLLDLVEYDGYVRTGSRSAYCVRFRDTTTNRLVYCLWTIRGERAATIGFAHDGTVSRVDENGNESRVALTNRCLQTRLSGTPFWIVSEPHITSVELGRPEHRERPGPHTLALDPLDSPWASDDRSYGSHRFYASNHWDLLRVPGAMLSRSVISGERTTRVWRIELQKPEKERKLAAWYGVFVPTQPIKIPGRARALGVWANGRSNWGRIIYEVEDAKGEVWQSIGAKDEWNCDDTHSWSSFNFDGWRYLRFPLPGHLPYDNYRDMDTVWWNCSAEGVVDLPVKLTRVIVEMRTHNVYADDCLEESDRSVELDDLTVEYDDAESMTVAPVARQREAARMALRRLSGGAQGSSQPSAPKPNRLRDEFPMK
jgi:hypothetical protein